MKRHKVISKGKRIQKLILFIAEIVILAMVWLALFAYSKLNLINSVDLDVSKVTTNGDLDEDTLIKFEGNTTIALFALDNRTQGELDNGNSDVIMVMNVNNDSGEISLVSVYRDTYLNVAAADESDTNFRKANAAYAYGGVEQAITMLNRNLDLDIDSYVTVDFQAVADAIDILGGVEIEINEDELDYLNSYIDDTSSHIDSSSEHVTSTGLQTLSGTQAVAYCRIRYTSGMDYERAERQRRVLTAMIDKAKSASLSELNNLINTIFPEISTDLAQREIISMAASMLDYDLSTSGGFPYYRNTVTLDSKGSVVVPCDLTTNVSMLHEQLFGSEDYVPSATVQEYNRIIIEQTGYDESSAYADSYSDEDNFTGTNDAETISGDSTE